MMTIDEKIIILRERLEHNFLETISNIKIDEEEAPFLELLILEKLKAQKDNLKNNLFQIIYNLGISMEDANQTIKQAYDNVCVKYQLAEDTSKSSNCDNQLAIQSIFYKFCFSREVVHLFLKTGTEQKEVAGLMENSKFTNESIPLIIFKAYARKHNIEINLNHNSKYNYKSAEFQLNIKKLVFHNLFFEILSTDFSPIENDDPLRDIAKDFIVCIDHRKTSLFVVIFSPIMGSYSLRMLHDYSTSGNLGNLDNNDNETIIKTIANLQT